METARKSSSGAPAGRKSSKRMDSGICNPDWLTFAKYLDMQSESEPLDEQSLENSIFFFLGSSDSESLENISLVASIREEQSLDSGSSSDSERF